MPKKSGSQGGSAEGSETLKQDLGAPGPGEQQGLGSRASDCESKMIFAPELSSCFIYIKL